VLVAKITPCFENSKGAVAEGLNEGVGYGTTELHVLAPDPSRLDSRFLYYITASADFRLKGEAAMSGAAGQKRVPEDYVRDYRITLPSLEQQRAIAAYLERETARLDMLAANYRQLIERLGEKRRTLIARAVTRGLDLDAPMKDSGIEWLGQVPAHWEVRRLGTLFKEVDKRGISDLPLLNVSINTGVSEREFSSDRIEYVASDLTTQKVARKGDIVFNKMRMWQGAVGVAPVDGLVSPDYVVARPTKELSLDYYETLLGAPIMSAEFARHSNGIVWDRLRLYWDGFKESYVPYPPIDEQRSIADYIHNKTVEISELIAAAQQAQSLLNERRGVLIAEVVAGKHTADVTAHA